MQTQKPSTVWLLALSAVGAGCTSTTAPKQYPLPYVGTRVTSRVSGTAATVGIDSVLDRRVGRGGESTNVGQEDAVRTWGLERAAHAPVSRGPSTGNLSGSQETARPAGVDATTTSRVGLSRSTTTVGMSSSAERVSSVDPGH